MGEKKIQVQTFKSKLDEPEKSIKLDLSNSGLHHVDGENNDSDPFRVIFRNLMSTGRAVYGGVACWWKCEDRINSLRRVLVP